MSESLLANRYRLGARVGSANHSEFYEGVDTQTDTQVIIRLIDIDQSNKKFVKKLEGFMANEFRVVKKLNHPNIFQILDYWLDGHIYYQVNEYLPFLTLEDYLRDNPPLDLQMALRFALETADVLSHLHHIGIIHCDVKPENMLLVNGNSIKLMEFSIANHIQEGDIITGTPPYMSPESLYGIQPAVVRDVWALGVTLFELVTGRVPYIVDANRMKEPSLMPQLIEKIIREPVPPITDFAPNLPPRLIALVNWMLDKNPELRLGSMRQVAAELEGVLADLAQTGQRLAAGDVIGKRYRLQTAIAEGGFGQVFRGADLQTGGTVAIKQLKPELASNPNQLARFKREAEVLNQLNHPGIVKVLDTIEAGDSHYIVMQYIDGGDLRSRMKQSALSIAETLRIGLELADALVRAHHLNIIHRDIKPENVLIASDGSPRLTDFGIAYVENAQRLTETGTYMGTWNYIAPEVIRGESASKLSDIWSLGIMLYEMVAGQQPFHRETIPQVVLAILNDPMPPIQDACADCPDDLASLMIHAMLERDPEKRMSSMREVASQLERLAK